MKVLNMDALAEDFNDDVSKSILQVQIHKSIDPQALLEKSIYNFDLDTPEGIDRLLELLPILDPEILNEVYQEIFPQYPVETLAPRVARLELRGYLMDYLNGEFEAGQEAETRVDEAAFEPGSDLQMEGDGPGPAQGPGQDPVAQEASPEGAPDEAPVDEPGSEVQ